MPFPAQLTRRESSISINAARSGQENAADDENRSEIKAVGEETKKRIEETTNNKNNAKDESDEGEATDIIESSSDEISIDLDLQIKQAKKVEASGQSSPHVRLSKRLMSMKRRGRIAPAIIEKEVFVYRAGDVLAVRGEEDDFYLCKVLEDVSEDMKEFRISWFNRVKEEIYEASFDDTCFVASAVDRVSLLPHGDNQFVLSSKLAKRIKHLIHQALKAENPDYVTKDIHMEEISEEDEGHGEESDEEEQPPNKRRKRTTRKAPIREKKAPKEKKASPSKPLKISKRRGLVPIPEIDLLESDPTFDKGSQIPLASVKWAIRDVLTKDHENLKKTVNDKLNVYSVSWYRSADIKLSPMEYALMYGDHDAIKILHDFSDKDRSAKCPTSSLAQIDTGIYNFFTFGHAVRPLTGSRGSREGNDAFNKDSDAADLPLDPSFLMKRGIDINTAEFYYKLEKMEFSTIINHVWRAVRNGHREVAGHFIKQAIEKDGYGFNFLHKEVLLNNDEPLSKFRASSVTKKPYENKVLLPIHCACINPNPAYLQSLLTVMPDYGKADATQRKPIHFAAACTGPGPMKLLLSRGLDPNDVDSKGRTPLMIASKHGRDEIIEAITSLTVEEVGDEDEVTETQRVNINAKSRAALTALHYAAKFGHTSTIKLLVEKGATVDIQCAAGKDNMTPLIMAVRHGHLEAVKVFVELGAKPDKKVRQNKTPLMFAILNGHAHIAAYLLNIGVDPNTKDTSTNTPIHYACGYGWYYCTKLLLEAGANPNVPNMWKTTPLALALLKDNEECAELLLSIDGVDVNFRDETGCTILSQQMLSAYDDKTIKRVKYLVEEKSADPCIPDSKGWTALHYLASHSVYKPKPWKKKKRPGMFTDYGKKFPTFIKEYSDVCCSVAKVLLDASADVNAVDEDGKSPIMFAVLQHNIPLLELFQKHGGNAAIGCDIETKRTALHCLLSADTTLNLQELYPMKLSEEDSDGDATKVFNKQVLKLNQNALDTLIACGADLDAVDKTGTTALMQTFQLGNNYLSMADLLIKAGASPLVGEDHHGHYLLHSMSADCFHYDAATYLKSMRKKFDFSELINKRDHDGFTPFLLASEAMASCGEKHGRIQLLQHFMKVLVELGADVNATIEKPTKKPTKDTKNYNRSVPDFGLQIDNFKKRLPAETDPFKDYGATGKFSFFHFLSLNDSAQLGMDFIYKAIDITLLNECDRYSRKPLHLALRMKNFKRAKELVKLGALFNVSSGNSDEDYYGTPLCMASRSRGSEEIISALLEAGADANVCDKLNNQSPLTHVCKWRTYDNVEPINIMKLMVGRSVNINSADKWNRIPLHYAVNAGSGGYEALTEIEDILIQNGANVIAQDEDRRTPMFYAFIKIKSSPSDCDPISLVTALCETMKEQSKDVSADLNLQDCNGQTVLHYCCIVGAELCCMYLLKAGASHDINDNDGNSPLSLAVKNLKPNCARLLLQAGAPADCDIVFPVTKSELEDYKKRIKEAEWRYKSSVSIAKPQKVTKKAFEMVIANNWHGVAYTMLELSGLAFIEAFKAALKSEKLSLLWTIMKKQRNKKAFLCRDSISNSNLLHILAEHKKFPECYDSGVEFAKILIDANVSLSDRDINGSVPLHCAAQNVNHLLAKYFIKTGGEVNALNNNNATPAASMIVTICDNGLDFSNHAVLIMMDLYNAGFNLTNQRYNVPAETVDDNQDKAFEMSSILTDTILLGNPGDFRIDTNKGKCIGSLEYFIKKGAEINIQTHEGQTPLMVAAGANQIDEVKLLVSKKADVNIQDIHGYTALHFFINHLEYGTLVDFTVATYLCKAGTDLTLKSKDGYTVLDMAKHKGADNLAQMLANAMKTSTQTITESPISHESNGYHFTSTLNEYWTGDAPDVKRDVQNEIKLNPITDIIWNKDPKVDKDFYLPNAKAEVYIDPQTGIPYDVVMTKVDVKWGHYGLNNFYKIQILYHKGKDLWIMFNKWGRISDSGQNQQTPYTTPEEAVENFKKIFKSKTGNAWEDKRNFVKKPKKYAIVHPETNPDKMPRYQKTLLEEFNLEECTKSKMPKEMQNLMKSITDICAIKTVIKRERLIETNLTPLGMVSRETLDKAKVVLDKVKDLVSKLENTEIRGNQSAASTFEEVAELSNEYYMLVPPCNYNFERISPLNQMDAIRTAEEHLWKLMELSFTYQILLAAQHRKKDVSPLDYCYKAINCHIEVMNPFSAECQMILGCIENHDLTAKSIFRVERPGENKNFADCGITENRRLLWHGTSRAHVVGICSLGFRIHPTDARKTGRRYGDGIYFSNCLSVAQNFCCSYGDGSSFVFLCEVACGKMFKVNRSSKYGDPRDEGDDSTWVETKEIPDPKYDVITPYGAIFHPGKMVDDSNRRTDDHRLPNRHECIVYDERQVRVRYLIQI